MTSWNWVKEERFAFPTWCFVWTWCCMFTRPISKLKRYKRTVSSESYDAAWSSTWSQGAPRGCMEHNGNRVGSAIFRGSSIMCRINCPSMSKFYVKAHYLFVAIIICHLCLKLERNKLFHYGSFGERCLIFKLGPIFSSRKSCFFQMQLAS